MSITILPISTNDESELSDICFSTSFVYPDISKKDLVNWKWLIPYCRIEDPNCFKAFSTDKNKIAGYILSTLNSFEFERKCITLLNKNIKDIVDYYLSTHKLSENDLVKYKEDFAYPVSNTNDPDYMIKKEYPAHLHINVLPEFQGKGLGHNLIDHLLNHLKKNNCPGIHLGVGAENTRAIKFYEKYGFEKLSVEIESALYFGLKL